MNENRLDALTNCMDRWIKPIEQKLHALSAYIVGFMSIPIFLDVISRMILNKSIPGVIEIEEFMMIFIVFLSLSHLQSEKEHVSIDIVFSRFPIWVQGLVDCFNHLVLFILFVLMEWQIILQVFKKKEELSFSLNIPISIFLGVAALGVLLLAIVLFIDVLKSTATVIKTGHWPWLFSAFTLAGIVMISPFLIKMILSDTPNGLYLGIAGLSLLMVFLLLKMPIGMAMALTGFLGMMFISHRLTAPLSILGIAPYHTTASFILAVVPLFILMGELAFYSGISKDLFDAANKWMGQLPGGLGMASVAGCAGFAAVCGDSMSTAVTMGAVSLPEMKKRKYDDSLSTGCLAAGGTLGILIPPSVGFIFYAIITEESVGKLFIAGILPGVLLATLFMLCIYIMAKIKPTLAPRGDSASFKDKLISLKGIVPMLLLFILILGGIIGGIFSPTEGGGIGAVGAFLYALARRRISLQNLIKAFHETAKLTTKLLMILIGVGILGYFLAATRLPFILSDFVTELPCGRYVILLSVLALFIVLGCLMNVIPMILLTLPAIYPSILALGFDPIWFGVITVIVMEMGQITPPIGVNVFALSSVAENVPMVKIFKGVIPFFICMIICVIVLIIFPSIATFLPNALF